MATLLIADIDGHAIGYLLGYRHSTFWAGADVWWVEELLVDDAHRKLGVGRALMDYYEVEARDAGGKLACLITKRAANFYRAIGYEEFALYFRKLL